MRPYPILFHPILKPRIWGGRSLASLGKQLPPGENIGESWEVADLPAQISDGRSVIANGELSGLTLRQAIARHRDPIMGDAKPTSDGGFPLLIKFLDARENLSVQVHPDEAYAAAHPGSHLKSEAWVIIHAVPGAVIYKGVKPGVTAEQFSEHIRSGNVIDDLIAAPARVGDCHYLPSGMCHALGAGVVVAEIQTPSDTTFRVYDWGRTGRELHVEEAMKCMRFGAKPPAAADLRRAAGRDESIEVDGVRTTPLCQTEFFTIERLDALDDAEFPVVTSGLPEVWMTIAGTGEIQTRGAQEVDLTAGTTVLIPAELEDATARLQRGAWLLRVKLPSPLKGLIAR